MEVGGVSVVGSRATYCSGVKDGEQGGRLFGTTEVVLTWLVSFLVSHPSRAWMGHPAIVDWDDRRCCGIG